MGGEGNPQMVLGNGMGFAMVYHISSSWFQEMRDARNSASWVEFVVLLKSLCLRDTSFRDIPR